MRRVRIIALQTISRCIGLAFPVFLGCQASPPGATSPPSASHAPSVPAAPKPFEPLSPYAPGAWRRAPDALQRSVLWPSHLLIRYAGVESESSVSFVMADFHSVPPPATRSREEALALATQLAEQARARPERFAELVRQHSEDIVRRDRGGSLGGIPAAQLMPWPEMLDALAQLRPGEVSQPVESSYGFHVLQRRAPPEPDTVTGRRIVIGHAQAGFLGKLNGGGAPARSRADALALAAQIYAEARARPGRFPALVQQYSEVRDRVVGGDIGTWSNREVCPFPSEVEILDHLQVGDVSAPFDSLFGIQIVQRVENRRRPEYAIDGVRLPFDPRLPEEDPRSEHSALAAARALNRRLLDAPNLLPELQAQHPPYASQWLEGRGPAEVTVALAAVQPGQLLREPAHSPRSYVIGRRAVPRPRVSEPEVLWPSL